jgi:hypothetical protein
MNAPNQNLKIKEIESSRPSNAYNMSIGIGGSRLMYADWPYNSPPPAKRSKPKAKGKAKTTSKHPSRGLSFSSVDGFPE